MGCFTDNNSRIIQKEVRSPCSEPLPSACLRSPTVVGCISLHEIRGGSDASTFVPANDDSSVVHLGSILPKPLSSPSANTLGKISPLSFWSPLTNLEAKHGCCNGDRASDRCGGKLYWGGGCEGKIFCLNQFTSAHRMSVCS